ncbi:unnamed protein product [Rotaria sp. Silwood2]|nr:unnamed protein product [Rotaria sp. Silwood2]CAF2868314.1 unnamed protein product [Rotaria sp. Silwood2]CAF3327560.1 unnamed protein product [Rotaria sp. Silwood2]CAF3418515.1 unnamed protein product [Rotaria sp. Silwood2]CAF4087089.1 unnamed protein product [Rotaria sp. Silwood2]
MVHENLNNAEYDIKDKNGDLDTNAPNPVNTNPQFMGDYPQPKSTTSKVPEMSPSVEAATGSPAINRPPKPPGPALGPFFQFISTDLKKMLWIGSALIFRHVSFNQPNIEFVCDPKVDYNWEILYENIFDLCAYRVNIFIELRSGEGEDKIIWKIDWDNIKTSGSFLIARCDQKWRGGFFSCNGFDAYVPIQVASNLTYSNVWNHLLSIHEETPLHLLLWGGDQNYVDFIFEDIPFLRAWINMAWNERWTTDFRDDLKEQVEQYHFYMYAENWDLRVEVKTALTSIPSLMMWDDHDIFDGAGSYPTLLHDSPVMMGLFLAAQKMRLLFQHHTTLEKAREHQVFGHQGYNFFARCGRHLAILGADQRTERDTQTVQHENTWNMIFDRLENNLEDVEHLIVLFPVPFSFIRVHIAESIFERLKNLPNKWRRVPLIKQTNSIFGLPELYDDLLDEWTHQSHIEERNRVLLRFQQIAEAKKVRITYFSGDVHCCGIGRFQTRGSHRPSPINDAKLMYQIVSSAIVNMPPSKMAIRVAHRFKSKWDPVDNTEEELIDFFERSPENGGKVFHKKFRPNRNWCYFEQCSNIMSSTVTIVQTRCLHCLPSKGSPVAPVTLGPNSSQEGKGGQESPIYHYSHRELCHELVGTDQRLIETHDLRIRLWLESAHKHQDGRQFVGYDLLIPNLK